MTVTNRNVILQFIKDNLKEKIRQNDWEYIYNAGTDQLWSEHDYSGILGDFTMILLQAGIDPLQYLDYIPEAYLAGSADLQGKFVIPNHIKQIKASAFYECRYLEELYIPKSVIYLGDDCFLHCRNLTIKYEGSREEWGNQVRGFQPCGSDEEIKVIFNDGDWDYL